MSVASRITVAAAFALVISGCTRSGDNSLPADAVATVGNEVITRANIVAAMPAGLPVADSTAFANAYIRAWIERRLVEQVAASEVNMEEIDRLTADYRSELIMAQYRRAMAGQADGFFAEDSLKAYFDAHKNDFRLERPLIKGIYLKVPDDAPNLNTIRQLYKSARPDDIDRLEKAANSSAIHYDYFRDTWVDLEQIETRIPIDFTSATMAKVNGRHPIDVTSQGFVYLLSISDVLPAGSSMPFETARPLVQERLLALRRRAYDKKLMNDLYDKAVADGTVKFPNIRKEK